MAKLNFTNFKTIKRQKDKDSQIDRELDKQKTKLESIGQIERTITRVIKKELGLKKVINWSMSKGTSYLDYNLILLGKENITIKVCFIRGHEKQDYSLTQTSRNIEIIIKKCITDLKLESEITSMITQRHYGFKKERDVVSVVKKFISEHPESGMKDAYKGDAYQDAVLHSDMMVPYEDEYGKTLFGFDIKISLKQRDDALEKRKSINLKNPELGIPIYVPKGVLLSNPENFCKALELICKEKSKKIHTGT